MKLLKLVALLVAVITVSGIPHMLKDAEREYLKRAIIRSMKEKFGQQKVAAPNDFKTDEDLDAIIPQINADTTSAQINADTTSAQIKADTTYTVDIKEDDTSPRYGCSLAVGDVYPKNDTQIISLGYKLRTECVKICLEKKKSIPSIIGVQLLFPPENGKRLCYCLKGPNFDIDTTADVDANFQYCIIKPISENRCSLAVGRVEPYNYLTIRIGYQFRTECVKICLEIKKTTPKVNAVQTLLPQEDGKRLCLCIRDPQFELDTAADPSFQYCIIKPISGDALM